MTDGKPGLFRAASKRPVQVYTIQQLLSYRDTWTTPLDDLDVEGKLKQAHAERQQSTTSIGTPVKPLETSANGFRAVAANDLSKSEQLVRLVQSTLNRLTTENFEALMPPLLQPALFEPDVANEAVSRIFDKSLDEPKYAALYANMCTRMTQYENSYLQTGGTRVRVSIVEKAQAVYESTRLEDQDPDKMRKRKLANIKFVGHLIHHTLLGTKIAHRIIDPLVKSATPPTDVDLEVAIGLLDHVGAFLDKKQSLDTVFEWLSRLVDLTEQYPQRLRFLMMNLIDLRKRQWQRTGTTDATASTPISAPAVSAPEASTAASLERRPPLHPEMPLEELNKAAGTIIGLTQENAAESLRVLSTLLKDQNPSINRAAALSHVVTKVCLESKPDARAMVADSIALGAFDKLEMRAAFSWAIANAVTAMVHEDCPKFHERFVTLFLQFASDRREHKALVREVLSNAADNIDAVYAEMEGGVEWDEAFHSLWTEFIVQSVARQNDRGIGVAGLGDVLDALSAFKSTGLSGRVMTDMISTLPDNKYCSYEDLAAWHTLHVNSTKLEHVVKSMELLV